MKRNSHIIERNRVFVFALLVLLGSSCVLDAVAAQKKADPKASPTPQQQAQPSPSPEAAIPLPQIVNRADELMQQVREMNDRLNSDTTVSSTDETLQAQDVLISENLRGLYELIAITPMREELLEREQEWFAQKQLYSTLKGTLSDRTKTVGDDVHFLEAQQSQWQGVLDQTKDPASIAAVSEPVRDVLVEIASTSKRANELLQSLLALQHRVAEQERLVLDALKGISQAKAKLQRSLLHPDSPPLWNAHLTPSDEAADRLVTLSFKRNLIRTQQYLAASRYSGLGILLVFVFALAGNIAISQRVRRWAEAQPDLLGTSKVLERPVSLSLLIALIVLLPLLQNVPFQVKALVVLLSLVPVLRLLSPLIRPVFRPFAYVLVVFGVVASFWETAVPSPALRRWGLAGWSLAAIAITVWLTLRARRELHPSTKKTRRAIVFIQLATAVVGVSVIANVFGYVALARVLRSGAVLSCYAGIVFYTFYVVTESVLTALARARRDRVPGTAVFWGDAILRWTLRLVKWAAWFAWVYGTLNFFAVREAVVHVISVVLTTPVRLRAVSFTLGDILTFILVLVAGIVLTSILRVVLKDGILARLNLKHGIPYAISTITYYLLLLFVFLLALSAAGVELSRFTVLTGAFGIGAGFGLQNVISNFVAGIILLFERPVRIGDFLEVENASGEVVRLGIRSSSILTFQGAEVIVPNSNLIANQVVNWSSSGQKQRADLNVKVAYGADPEKVSELILKTIRSHPVVANDPEPLVFFLGFGDNSLDFELMFWVPDFMLRQKVRSEIAMRIAHEFKEAGIEIPAPRRELHVTGINTPMKDSRAADESKGSAPEKDHIDSATTEGKM